MGIPRFRRRNYLVDKSYQGKYIAAIVLICGMGMAFVLTLFNIFSRRAVEVSVWRVHMSAESVGELVTPYLIWSTVALLPFAAALTMALARAFRQMTAPPLFRLRRYIDLVGDGNLTVDLDWVMNDEFKATADELNNMTLSLRKRMAAIKDKSSELETACRALKTPADCDAALKIAAELKQYTGPQKQ